MRGKLNFKYIFNSIGVGTSKLQKLKLGCDKIDKDSLILLFKNIKFPYLKDLTINTNENISDCFEDVISTQVFESLTSLVVKYNTKLDDQKICFLKKCENLPVLKELNLLGCHNISRQCLQEIMSGSSMKFLDIIVYGPYEVMLREH